MIIGLFAKKFLKSAVVVPPTIADGSLNIKFPFHDRYAPNISDDNNSLGKPTDSMAVSYANTNDSVDSYYGDFAIDKNFVLFFVSEILFK